MTWTCELVDYPGDWTDLSVGQMFYGPTEAEALAGDEKWDGIVKMYAKHLSDYYRANNAHRRPLFVIMPGMAVFCIDGQTHSNGVFAGGWTVTGEAPNITVQPSINLGGVYHGWLQNGVITDDCEGRQYNEDGYQRRQDVPGQI